MESKDLRANFNEIMKTMNNGLDNESTLVITYPLIVKLCLNKNPNKVGNVMTQMCEEEILTTRPHPGLNKVMLACQNTVEPLLLNKEMSVEKDVVVKTIG